MLFASIAPVTVSIPPTVASLVTDKPVPLALLNVNVSAISAVLFASIALVTNNLLPTLVSWLTTKPLAPVTFVVSVSKLNSEAVPVFKPITWPLVVAILKALFVLFGITIDKLLPYCALK